MFFPTISIRRRRARFSAAAAGAVGLVLSGALAFTPAHASANPVPGVLSQVTVPPVTLPPVTIPSVTLPSVTVPPVSTPLGTTPTVSTPPVSTPPLSTPEVSTPTVTVPPLAAGSDLLPSSDGASTGVPKPAPPVTAPKAAPAASAATAATAPIARPAFHPDTPSRVPAGEVSRLTPSPVARRVTPATAARELAIPASLSLLIAMFLVGQAWVDARDPRLAAAPIDSDEQLSFT